ncbi:MAG TPA: hypothetical protein VFM55_05145 [Micromonosporaceae bacterium]|nr:hypothetical protein [Micromonosporaceae bacterium]
MLIFVGVPAAVVAVVAGLVYGGSRRGRRYRPGRPFEFTPVWFLSSQAQPSGVGYPAGDDRRAVTGAAERAALPAGEEGPEPAAAAPHGATGGASDRW